jgi:hypothetical protein
MRDLDRVELVFDQREASRRLQVRLADGYAEYVTERGAGPLVKTSRGRSADQSFRN